MYQRRHVLRHITTGYEPRTSTMRGCPSLAARCKGRWPLGPGAPISAWCSSNSEAAFSYPLEHAMCSGRVNPSNRVASMSHLFIYAPTPDVHVPQVSAYRHSFKVWGLRGVCTDKRARRQGATISKMSAHAFRTTSPNVALTLPTFLAATTKSIFGGKRHTEGSATLFQKEALKDIASAQSKTRCSVPVPRPNGLLPINREGQRCFRFRSLHFYIKRSCAVLRSTLCVTHLGYGMAAS